MLHSISSSASPVDNLGSEVFLSYDEASDSFVIDCPFSSRFMSIQEHDGEVLKQILEMMATYKLGLNLSHTTTAKYTYQCYIVAGQWRMMGPLKHLALTYSLIPKKYYVI